jgi:ribonuclease VapC
MVIDSSALLAIVFGEEDSADFIEAIASQAEQGRTIYIPAAVLVEAGIAAERRGEGKQLDALVTGLRAVIVPFDHGLAKLALTAFRHFGRGFHNAALNFGDCMTYATATQLQLPLLYKGDDFRKTNIPSVLAFPN